MSKTKEKAKPVSERTPDTGIGDAMQDYFQTHGVFRAADVQRVLGNPAEGVGVKVSEELISFSKAK